MTTLEEPETSIRTVTAEIDGRSVTVPEGTTIYDAAHRADGGHASNSTLESLINVSSRRRGGAGDPRARPRRRVTAARAGPTAWEPAAAGGV